MKHQENQTDLEMKIPIQFRPIYQQRVWGGRWLGEKYGRDLPPGQVIGESWEIVDRREAQSVHAGSGKTLRALLQQHSAEIMGPDYDASRPFPILVKWLDCSQRLSLQVHPPSEVAVELGSEPKTECWYIVDATPDAALIVGLKHGTSRQQFEQAIADNALEPLLHRIPVRPGESMLLESGRLHAIDAGNLILEIQQNSDTTYRVYDWGRKGLDGKPRQLHVEESLKSIDFDDFEPAAMSSSDVPGTRTLAKCAEFRIRQVNLARGDQLNFNQAEPMILSLMCGTIEDKATATYFPVGTNLLLPFVWTGTLSAISDSTVLLTDRFI